MFSSLIVTDLGHTYCGTHQIAGQNDTVSGFSIICLFTAAASMVKIFPRSQVRVACDRHAAPLYLCSPTSHSVMVKVASH